MSSAARPDLTIVIAAAGSGERLGLGAKALLEIDGHSLLYWLSTKAKKVAAKVIVAIPPADIAQQAFWVAHCPGCEIIEGAESHLRTFAKLVHAADLPWIMNLNVSLPFVSVAMMHKVAAAANETGIAGAFLKLDLPVAQVEDAAVKFFSPSRQATLAQGPNAYLRSHLLDLIARADEADWARQSFLEIATRHGFNITAVAGEKTNIKITTAEDWVFAQALVHQFGNLLQ